MDRTQENQLFQTLGSIEGKLDNLLKLPERVSSLEKSRAKLYGWLSALTLFGGLIVTYLKLR
jgi:hypothetical protein